MPDKEFPRRQLAGQLLQALDSMALNTLADACDDFLDYLELLCRWNRAYNLTGIKSVNKMLTHHVLDSLSVLPYLHGDYCLDMGTGAGLPGLILALARPDTRWVLLDSNQKKIRFVNHVVLELGLENVETVCCRVQDYRPEQLFSTILSRALTTLAAILDFAAPLLTRDGVVLAMKGEPAMAESQQLHDSPFTCRVEPVPVPGIKTGRFVVIAQFSKDR